MTTTTYETTVSADPHLPVLRIVREFDAPRSRVFRAHVDPELFAQWVGPHGLEMRIDHHDCRTGGSYRFEHRRGDEVYGFHGSFHEVRPDEVIVQTFTFEGGPDAVSLERLVLEDLGGRTRLTVTAHYESFAAREAMVSSGMETGVREGYERLEALLS